MENKSDLHSILSCEVISHISIICRFIPIPLLELQAEIALQVLLPLSYLGW